MTESTRSKYEEDRDHYDLLREIVKDASRPTNSILKTYIGISISVFAYLFWCYISMNNSIQSKANESEVLLKIQYYQIEKDEHRMLLELQPDVNKATNVFNKINANIIEELGFRLTTRSAENTK